MHKNPKVIMDMREMSERIYVLSNKINELEDIIKGLVEGGNAVVLPELEEI